MKKLFAELVICFAFVGLGFGQIRVGDEIDTTAIRKIWNEGTQNSEVMELAQYLTEVCGPRLTGSPQYMKAARWTMLKMSAWGLSNVHLEAWGPFGRSWSLKDYSATVTEPDVFPLFSFPKAWSPSTKGNVEGDVVYFDAQTDSALATFRGKLKGAFVLMGEPRALRPEFEPRATRREDTLLLSMANSDMPSPRGRRRFTAGPEDKARGLVEYKKLKLALDEGAHAILTSNRGDAGNIFVQQASAIIHPDTPMARRPRVWDAKASKFLPQVAVSTEHYNRLARLVQRNLRVRLEMNLDVAYHRADSAHNVIAEIAGTDLADEVVMIGAHLDSWHGGTGATDNATGVAACLEAVRILQRLGLKPRRTIRVGLWSGEEQGIYGSEAYVRQHFGQRSADSLRTIALKPAAEKFSAYFNDDNGAGRFRGVYMQGNEAVRPIFRRWLTAIGDPSAQTLTLMNTGSTDHVPFDQVGLPAFQFIQDNLEYNTLTHHSTMDVYDRLVPEDLQQSAIIMAIFAYNAAMRDEKLPRKPAR
ncbi:MAG: M20/M25/M40 family metallo-hydrolase [Ignavibacteriae bacterium]|nr:M20/M25/M40 family metallo-hydrolase [Ignavibacteriota bacterium]